MTPDRRKTTEEVMEHLMECKTDLGQQIKDTGESIQSLKDQLAEHQKFVATLLDEWKVFQVDFKELMAIFRSGRGFFKVLITTGHWPGMGK